VIEWNLFARFSTNIFYDSSVHIAPCWWDDPEEIQLVIAITREESDDANATVS